MEARCLAAGGRRRRLQPVRHPLRLARRHSRHLGPANRRLREVAAKRAAARSGSHRTADQLAHRLARHPVDSRYLSYGVLVHLRHPGQRRAARDRAAAGARSNQHHPAAAAAGCERDAGTERQQHGLDLPVCAGRSRRGSRPAGAPAGQREPDQAGRADGPRCGRGRLRWRPRKACTS